MMMKFLNAGYTLWSPPSNLVSHLWSRSYRPTYAGDTLKNEFVQQEREVSLKALKDLLNQDETFTSHMKKCGVCLSTKSVSDQAICGGIDASLFK